MPNEPVGTFGFEPEVRFPFADLTTGRKTVPAASSAWCSLVEERVERGGRPSIGQLVRSSKVELSHIGHGSQKALGQHLGGPGCSNALLFSYVGNEHHGTHR